jgi:hypothetical protein
MNNDETKKDVSFDLLIPAFQAATPDRRAEALALLRDEGDAEGEEDTTETWMSQTELANHFGVHPVTIGRWNLPCVREHGRPRYCLSVIENHMKSRSFKGRICALKHDRARRT